LSNIQSIDSKLGMANKTMNREIVMLLSMRKILFVVALIAVPAAGNAVPVYLFSHSQTTSSGFVNTRITDGSHTSGIAGGTTALWDWDGTSLTSIGLYSSVFSLDGSRTARAILSDQIVDLSINFVTGSVTATSYSCVEGTFFIALGLSICGGYDFGANFIDDSTTVWGPGTAISQILGGDDVATGGGPRSISAYDFNSVQVINSSDPNVSGTLFIGNGIPVGSAGSELMVFGAAADGSDLPLPVSIVPVPASVWLFGSALGLLGWSRRKAN